MVVGNRFKFVLKVKQGASAVLASMTNAKAGARPFEASASHAANGSATVAEIVKLAPPSATRSSSSSSNSARKILFYFKLTSAQLVNFSFFFIFKPLPKNPR